MTLQQLKYAVEVADAGTMSEAAKRLFISQPSLSGTIKELEKELGIQLFLRSNRGIDVTAKGEEFLGYARQMTEQYTRPKTSVSTSRTAITTKSAERMAGSNCILASQPRKACVAPVKSKNSSVMPQKHSAASIILILRSIRCECTKKS